MHLTCGIAGCDEPARARSWCRGHYNRWYYSGSPEYSAKATQCVGCGAEFEADAVHAQQLYCSQKCRSKADRLRHPERERRYLRRPKRPADCPECGAEFETWGPQRFCSRVCRESSRARAMPSCSEPGCEQQCLARGLCSMHYSALRVLKPCAVCGSMFEKSRADERSTCSDRCRYVLTFGRERNAGKELVGPVRRRRIVKPGPMVLPKLRFISAQCDWCGEWFTQDLRITGMPMRWCSHRCIKKRGKAKRRAREMGAPGTYTWAEVMRLYLRFGGCAYCGTKAEVEPDHVVPLSRGGSNSITNVVPACRACNHDKRDLLLTEWYEDRKRRGLPPVLLTPQATHLTDAFLVA